ncbi:MAG: right-handed parallel beta-helix repeat-containing protein, partial [Kiritimatiellaeota bacterium]|nr:right-handed parallel beta-helix repeat-containing protein [Kiritimatiellota bacterium]
MKSIGLVFVLALAASGAEKIPPNPEAIAKVAAGRGGEACALWWGFDSADATAALQAAINSGARKLVVENPGAPWIVNKLYLASDQEIVFEPGVVVQAKRGAFRGTGDCLFTATLRTNVTLTGRGATLRMWKSDYDDKAQYEHAEWRHVLSFKSSANVQVTGLTLADSGGDGIYLGVGRCGVPCSDVVIRDVVCTNNYRQGISVISARNLLIENCTLTDTWGSAPEAGIDFEPNLDSEELVHCVMRNCVSANNRGDAYTFYLKSLRRTSRPISILLENCRAEGSRRSLAFVTGNDGDDAGVTGTMECNRCTYADGQHGGIVIGNKPASGTRVTLRACVISNPALTNAAQAPVEFFNGGDATEPFGAVQFERVAVHDPLGRMPPFAFHDSSGAGLRDIGGDIAMQRSNETAKVIQLTPALLAEWLPHTSFKTLPKFVTAGVRYEPALPQSQPPAKVRSAAHQRGPSEWLLWAEAGKPAHFFIHVRQVGKAVPKPAPVHIVAPSGAVTELLDTQ